MEPYDPRKVGKLIAWAGDHFVYHYGEDEIIKFSKFEFLLGQRGREKALHDYAVCQKYFSHFVLPTTFESVPRGKRLAKIQKRIEGHALTKDDLKRSDVRLQFEELLEGYARLRRDGHVPPDLIGGHGMFAACLSNVFLLNTGKLSIIDTMLMDFPMPFMRPFVAAVRTMALYRQHKILRLLLTE